jgi:hypothetical protein
MTSEQNRSCLRLVDELGFDAVDAANSMTRGGNNQALPSMPPTSMRKEFAGL